MTRHGPPAPFFGQRMLLLAIVTAVMTGPGQTIGVAVFIDHIVEALGTTRPLVSSAYLVGTLTGAVAMPFIGRLVDHRGIRIAQTAIGAAFSVALLTMSGVNSLPWLIVGFAGIRMFGQGALSMISTVTVALWYERRRGLAMGILTTVAGALMTLVPVVLNAVIEATSWRIAWMVAAVAVSVVVVPAGWFGLIDRPAAVGQWPDGLAPSSSGGGSPPPAMSHSSADNAAPAAPAPTVSGGASVETEWVPRVYTRAQAVRTRQFWVLVVIGSVSGMLITGLNFHQIDMLGEAGLSSSAAAAMFLPQILGSSVTALGTGYLMDRVGTRFVPALSMVLLTAVHLVAANLDGGPQILVYAVSLGAVGGTVRAALSTMVPGYFGTAHIGAIQGLLTVAGVAGSAIGPVALALVETTSGSYRSANLILMSLAIAALLFSVFNKAMPTGSGEGEDSGTAGARAKTRL